MGILACHVDDLLYGGKMQFYDLVINSLRDKLVFGSENASTFTYIGMHVLQHPDKSISLDQSSFMDSITPIAIPPDIALPTKVVLSPKKRLPNSILPTVSLTGWQQCPSHKLASKSVRQVQGLKLPPLLI